MRSSLSPARLLTFPPTAGGILGGQFRITWVVFLGLGAHLPLLRTRLGNIESSVERRDTPYEVGAARIRPCIAAVGRTLETPAIARPFSGADGGFASAGHTCGMDARKVTGSGAATRCSIP